MRADDAVLAPEAGVLDTRCNPIPGLLAAGADSGGLWQRPHDLR